MVCNYEWGIWFDVSSGSSGPAPPGVTCYYQHIFCRTHYISCHGGQGARHRCLQLRWWPLTDLPTAPLGGAPSTSPALVVAAVGPTASTLQGAHHQRLQFRWWLLPDLPPAPPREPTIDVSSFGGGRCQNCCQHSLGGPPSTSPASVVAAAGTPGSTPRGPAIDISSFGGGY
jgi:hypothetical protein